MRAQHGPVIASKGLDHPCSHPYPQPNSSPSENEKRNPHAPDWRAPVIHGRSHQSKSELKKDGETEKQKLGGRRALSGRQGGEKQLKRGMACNNHPCTGQVLAARATIRARMRGRSKAQIAQHGIGMLCTVSTHHGSAVSTSRERGRPTFGIANRRLIRTPNGLHDRVSWQMQLSARSATLFHGNRWTAGTAGVGGSQRLLEG